MVAPIADMVSCSMGDGPASYHRCAEARPTADRAPSMSLYQPEELPRPEIGTRPGGPVPIPEYHDEHQTPSADVVGLCHSSTKDDRPDDGRTSSRRCPVADDDESAEYAIRLPEWDWSHVPAGLLADAISEKLSNNDVVAYCLLQSIVGDPPRTRGELAEMWGVSKRTLQRRIAALEEAGWLVREGDDENGYSLLILHERGEAGA